MKVARERIDQPGHKWKDQYQKLFALKRLRWGVAKPSQECVDSEWYQCLPHRLHAAVTFLANVEPTPCTSDITQTLADDDQNSRIGHGTLRQIVGYEVEVTPPLVPEGKVWMFDKHRWILGYEAMILQGIPMQQMMNDVLDKYSECWSATGRSATGKAGKRG